MDTTSKTAGPSFGSRLLRALRNLLIVAVVLACAGAAAYALSLLNARRYSVQIADGTLVVLKGRMLPFGADPWRPTDPTLAAAYAPLELKGNNPVGLTQQTFDDRDELDQALFTVIELLARPRVSSDAPKDLEEGYAFLRRADQLSGLSETQKASLKQMRTEVSFYLARTRLQDAQKQVEQAIEQLKVAAQSDSRHARAATQMLQTVEPQARALADAMRAAVNTLSAPGTSPTLTPPPPPPPADGTAPAEGTTPAEAPDTGLAPLTGAPTQPEDSQTVTR